MLKKPFQIIAIAAMLAVTASISFAGITKEEVKEAQKAWADGIVKIGKTFTEKGDYKAAASKHIDTLYAYQLGDVLFKPTKASEDQFRGTKQEALSYFVTGNIAEDKGFAIAPWTKVRFENEDIILEDDFALAMGNYYFTGKDGKEVKVEYTFGYIKDENNNLRINLHHSSLPFHKK